MRYNLYFLKKFNNYHNRKLIRYADLDTYLDEVEDWENPENAKGEPTAVDFNPNDGITTQIVTNWGDRFEPDYLLVCKQTQSGYEIVSRWFVQEWLRTRGQQYQVSLRRDVIADNYNEILNASMFIQKGILDSDNPLIYTRENMEYNQIKKEEILLKDETQKNWIVGYIAPDMTESVEVTKNYELNENVVALGDLPLTLNPTTLSGTFKNVYFGNVSIHAYGPENFVIDLGQGQTTRTGNTKLIGKLTYSAVPVFLNATYEFVRDFAYRTFTRLPNEDYNIERQLRYIDPLGIKWKEKLYDNADAIISDFYTYKRNLIPSTSYMDDDIFHKLALQRVVIYDAQESKYYKMDNLVKKNTTSTKVVPNTSNIMPTTFALVNQMTTDMVNEVNAMGLGTTLGKTDNPRFEIEYREEEYSFSLTDVTSEVVQSSYKVNISATANKLDDAPYKMFFMQYSDVNMAIAQEIAISLGSKIYDLQLVPYCPDVNLINSDSLTESFDYNKITRDNAEIDRIYYAKLSSGQGVIDVGIDIDDVKIQNETQFVRIVSPNYNGAYEFIPAKNGGLQGVYYYFTYKPYSPYIQVQPIFGGLYGSNFGDARGLICNGDFSLPMTSDAFTNYEIQNKNYQNIFNAQIKTNDKNNNIGIVQQAVGLGLGVGSSVFGAVTGNPLALAGGVGGLVGGLTGLIGGQEKYQNTRQLQIDQFGYQLGNIKALPNTLSKVSAYNINNKYFPFIEIYDCTDVEKEALRNKIKYNGMTVMTIGKMSEFVGKDYNGLNYFQARLIINEDASMDYHMMSEIDAELQKGIYL